MKPERKNQTLANPKDPMTPDAETTAVSEELTAPRHSRRKRYAIYICQGAVIAALYVVLTEIATLMGLSSGVVQFRISEALCMLPMFTPVAIPALFIGCLISNILAGGILIDIIFGAVATLIGAAGAYLLRKWVWLAPIPTVVANVLIVPPILKYAYQIPTAFGTHSALPFFMLTVGAGEVVCAYIGGVALWFALKPHRKRLFPDRI